MDSSPDLHLTESPNQGVSRSGRVRKKSSKYNDDYFESVDEVIPTQKKKLATPKTTPKMEEEESSTSDSTTSSSDESDDDGSSVDIKNDNWEDDPENTDLNVRDDDFDEDSNLQVDEDTRTSKENQNFSQAHSLYFSEKKKYLGKDPNTGQKKSMRKDKGKPRLTAYMLWAKENRKEIMESDRDIDFSSVNKKLGELWALVPTAKKHYWRRKAKLALKQEKSMGRSMISTGRGKPGASDTKSKLLNKGRGATAQHLKQIESRTQNYGIEPTPVTHRTGYQTPKLKSTSASVMADVSPPNSFKVTGTSPIDVASHLKLLGESLNNIGQKLKEHEGQIAVSGSLSVLLDSMLCVLGPLACLINQLEETNGAIPEEILNNILDNIAYIMPGIV